MKKLISILLVLAMTACLLCGCGSSSKTWKGTHTVEMEFKGYGTITLEINCDIAPITGSNFLNLAKKGFYNGTTIHRVIDGFAIYGGDPQGTGRGTSGETITGEFLSNGYNNTLSNTRGAIGMARGIHKDSASCQFYILQNDATYLDGDFAVFGYVTTGMDIIQQIADEALVSGSDGYILAANQPVISSVKVK